MSSRDDPDFRPSSAAPRSRAIQPDPALERLWRREEGAIHTDQSSSKEAEMSSQGNRNDSQAEPVVGSDNGLDRGEEQGRDQAGDDDPRQEEPLGRTPYSSPKSRHQHTPHTSPRRSDSSQQIIDEQMRAIEQQKREIAALREEKEMAERRAEAFERQQMDHSAYRTLPTNTMPVTAVTTQTRTSTRRELPANLRGPLRNPLHYETSRSFAYEASAPSSYLGPSRNGPRAKAPTRSPHGKAGVQITTVGQRLKIWSMRKIASQSTTEIFHCERGRWQRAKRMRDWVQQLGGSSRA